MNVFALRTSKVKLCIRNTSFRRVQPDKTGTKSATLTSYSVVATVLG